MAQENKFVFTREEAASVGVTEPEKLPELIDNAVKLARAPISTFEVGAVGLASSGHVYLGVNVEFPGLPLHHSIHAEQFLVTNLALNSEQELTHLAVSADKTNFGAPCGHCLQFYQEMRNASQIKILIKSTKDGRDEFKSLDTLMPESFGPASLRKVFPLLLEPQNNSLILSDTDSAIVMICSDPEHCCSHMECMALTAANKSYAPHSECPSGVALVCEGEIYRGWYIESVAYNPSLGPVQAALVDFVARGEGKGFDKITAAVLVEKNDAKVSQAETARMLLKKIAPQCIFNFIHCYKKPEET